MEKQPELKPLVEFRNLLVGIRDNRELRQRVERKGKSYLGPLTIETRKRILNDVERIWHLPKEEKEAIFKIWRGQ